MNNMNLSVTYRIFSFILAALLLTACKPGPRSGHYQGYSPDVSFDLSPKGEISNFKIYPLVYSTRCYSIGFDSNVFLDDHNSFAWNDLEIPHINGHLDGSSASGYYQINSCLSSGDTLMWVAEKWSAELVQ